MPTRKKHIVLGVTGSIAAYKAAEIIRRLQDEGFLVSVVMTRDAEEFITPLTLASLSGNKVHRKLFDQDQDNWEISHVRLAAADGILIAPATANTIGKIACGIADDLLTCLAMATKAPVLLAPAMNAGMYTNPVVQTNCQKLRELGVHFISPVKGKLACGTIGEGHLAEVDAIIKEVKRVVR
jgi:phosphopantothenoylcysteine synthetase/decarboxylase